MLLYKQQKILLMKNYFKGPMKELGLARKPHWGTIEQYSGEYKGRKVNVFLRAVYRHPFGGGVSRTYTGHNLEIYFDTDIQTRLIIGRKKEMTKKIEQALKCELFPIRSYFAEEVEVKAIDQSWGSRFIRNKKFETILKSLFKNKEYFPRALRVDPGATYLMLRCSPKEMTKAKLDKIFSDLLAFTKIAESLPVPTVTAESSTLELNTRGNRGKIYLIAWLIILGFFGIIGAIVAGVLFWAL
jgi:hypothetical protein